MTKWLVEFDDAHGEINTTVVDSDFIQVTTDGHLSFWSWEDKDTRQRQKHVGLINRTVWRGAIDNDHNEDPEDYL